MATSAGDGGYFGLSFGDRMSTFEIEHSKNGIELTCHLYSCNITTRTFEISEKDLINRRIVIAPGSQSSRECQVTIVEGHTLKIAETKLSFPFLLLKKCIGCNKKGSKFMVVGLLPTDAGLSLTQVGIYLSIPFDADWGPYIANGPSVCWSQKGYFYVHLFNHNSSDFVCRKFFVCDASLLYRIVDISLNFTWNVRSYSVCGILSIVIWSERVVFTSQFTFSTEADKILKYEKFDVQLNSQFYQCLKQYTASRFVEGNDQAPSQLVVTNALSQIMLFTDLKQPVLRGVSTIPFCNVKKIQVYNSSSKRCCIVTSSDGKSCILDLLSFKISASHEVPFTIFIGDFLHVGGCHLLFLRCKVEDSGIPFMQRHFEITDMEHTILITGNAEELKVDPSLLTTANALQSRLMAGKLAVSNAKSDLCHLTTATSDIAFTLQSLAMGEEQSCEKHKPYVFEMLTGRQLPITHDIGSNETHSCKPLDVGLPWKRTVEDKWIIGINIRNCSTKKLWNFHLILTSPFHHIEHDSKVFLIGENYLPLMPTASPPTGRLCPEASKGQGPTVPSESERFVKVLQPGQSAMLTAVLSSDLLDHQEKMVCNGVVTFTREGPGNRPVDAVTGCSPFTCAVQDFLMEEHRIKFQSEDIMDALCDLAAVDAITESKEVTFVSKSTSLYGISKILQDKLQFAYHPKLQVFNWNKMDVTVFMYIWIEIQSIENSFHCHCNVHIRNRGQFFKLIHYLYEYLPEDILILPQNQDYEAAFSSHLMREANLVTSFFGAFVDQQISTNEPTSFTNVAEARESFMQRKKSFDDPPNPYANIDIKDYRTFRKQLFQYEQASDNAFISILNKKPK